MKTRFLFIAMLLVSGLGSLSAQSSGKAAKAEQLAKLFQETKALVESNRFKVTINQVYPQNGMDMTRFNPRGEIVINDSIAKGNLPFFGRAYTLPYGEGGGIEFDGPMVDKSVKIIERKNKKLITWRFSIRGQNDIYQLSIEIAPGGNCSVYVNSNNRTHISYSGTVSPLEEK